MNMAKLRQILELRRATKMAPLLPPKKGGKRANDELAGRRSQPREILDIHLQLRNFEGPHDSAAGSIACAFSESDETQRGPWRVTTASELLSRESCVDMPNVVALEFQLERVQFLRLDLCDLFPQKEATSVGYCIFSVSELVCARGGCIRRKVINDETGAEIAEAFISFTLRPKPHAVVLQFAASNLARKGTGNSAMSQIFFEIHRMPAEESEPYSGIDQQGGGGAAFCNGTTESEEGGSSPKSSLLYRSEGLKWSARLLWRTFTLQSTDIARRELRLLCFQRDHSKSPALPPLPLGEFAMHFSVLRRGPGPENVYFLVYEDSRQRKKTAGTFELCRLHEVCTPSFLEYIAAGSALNLAFAVDFSRPDSAVDETAVRHYVDDVELAIGAFGEPLRDFNSANSFAAFGIGAKIPPHFRESQEFCLNLDTDPYCRGLHGVLGAFKSSFASVQPLNMAHLSHVIYYVAKLAQNSLCRASPAVGGIETDYNPPAYFVLVLITRGVFDDLKETIQAIIFASRAPLSIVFVGIGDDDQELGELERLATAGTRLNFHGRKPERDCTQYVSVPACRVEEAKLSDLKALIAERGLATLCAQMCSWMMRNGYQKAPSDLELPSTMLSASSAAGANRPPVSPRHPLQPPSPLPPAAATIVGARSSTGSLGTAGGSSTHSSNRATAAPHRLDGGRGTSAQSLVLLASPSSSSSSGHGTSATAILSSSSFISGGTSTTTSSTSNARKSPVVCVQQGFRNLELDSFAVSLPSSPRRRLPSTISVENNQPAVRKTEAASKNYQKTQSGSSLTATNRHQMFVEARSLSSQSSEVPGRNDKSKTTMTSQSMNRN